jgi:4-hydroxybenzoate polyprenyltransferase
LFAVFLKKLTGFIVYTNLFIATCALALTVETFILLKLPASINWYLLLLFLCTVFVYNLHYFQKSKKDKTDDRLRWCRQHKNWLFISIIASALLIAGGVIFHFNLIFLKGGALNYSNLALFIGIPLLALGYSHPLTPWNKKGLRQTGWFKIISLSFTWSFTTTVLPVLMLLPGKTIPITGITLTVLFIHRFFFIAALCVLFNINDYEEDKADGVKTLAVLLGPERSLRQGKWLALLLNSFSSLWFIDYFHMHSIPFYIAIFIPVGLLFYSYYRFYPAKDEAIFIIRYDGLMIVKALLLIFALLIFLHK